MEGNATPSPDGETEEEEKKETGRESERK